MCFIDSSFSLYVGQVIFQYVGYNESGRRIDSTYLQGTPAKVRMGTNALIPGVLKTQYSLDKLICSFLVEENKDF